MASAVAGSQSDTELNGANVAWMMTASALVLMMTGPGLALFYGGLVRKKNILGVMMQCVFLMGLMSGPCGDIVSHLAETFLESSAERQTTFC